MLKHLIQFVASISTVLKAQEIVDITLENPPNKALSGFEFAVINFYDDSAASEEVKTIFKSAMILFKEEE